MSAFPRGRRPAAGCEVTYVELRDESNRTRASEVRYLTAPASALIRSRTLLALVVAALFFVLLVCFVLLGQMPLVVPVVYGLLSCSTFLVYGADKSAAEQGRWRTSESTLHTISLVGGWPGALVARPYFRHKTTKQPFRTIFWITVGANCAALTWLVYEQPLSRFW